MAQVKRTRLGRLAGDAGAELIELAIVLPIFLFIVAGIMDFGFLFQRWEVLTNAAREGARVAVLPQYTATDAQARVQSYLNVAGLASAPVIDVVYTTEPVDGPGGSGPTVSLVKVTVQYPSQFLFLGPFVGLLGGGSSSYGTINLKAASTMRVEVASGGT